MTQSDIGGAHAFAAAFDDPDSSEHVLLEADEVEILESASRVRTAEVVRELELFDRVRRVRTALVLFDDGRLRVERRRGRGPVDVYTVDLGFLDPVPMTETRVATRAGRVALLAGGATALAGALAAFGVLAGLTGALAAVGATVAAGAGFAFVYLSVETATFVTRLGRAAAIRLTATPGSIAVQRRAVPVLTEAIERAREATGEETTVYLKSEMREHYRLRGEGVISEADCSTGTARVLAHFDEHA